MTTEEQIQLIAKVLAWQVGTPLDEIAAVAASTLMQDDAQQCAEDLGIA